MSAGTQAGCISGQKLLNRKISPLPSQQTGDQALPNGELGPSASAPLYSLGANQPDPRPTGAQTRASYLDRESRRDRQEDWDRGKGAVLKGDPWVFLTMRYRVLITLLVGGVRRVFRLDAAEKAQTAGQWVGRDAPHASFQPHPTWHVHVPGKPSTGAPGELGTGPSPRTQATGMW